MIKKYSLRIDIEFKNTNDDEAKRLSLDFIKELPRISDFRTKKISLYNLDEKKMVDENLR